MQLSLMMAQKLKDLKNTIKSLEQVINILIKYSWHTSEVGGKYGELYAAEKLWSYIPQIGSNRENKSSDIFLSKIKKRIEVKWGVRDIDDCGCYWSWEFGEKQLTEKKFDYCVLIASETNGKPKYCFIFTQKELSKLTSRKGGIPQKLKTYYISFYEDYNKIKRNKKCVPKINYIENDLNTNKQKYNNRWDKIN
jgi:hypothetical protein